jgi:hypothetical protein
MPGISVFKKDRNSVVRVSDSALHPGDDFCALWHIFDLLPEGRGIGSPSSSMRISALSSGVEVSIRHPRREPLGFCPIPTSKIG